MTYRAGIPDDTGWNVCRRSTGECRPLDSAAGLLPGLLPDSYIERLQTTLFEIAAEKGTLTIGFDELVDREQPGACKRLSVLAGKP